MAEDFRYSDDGNHQMWTDSHQGSAYSRVNRVHRFFIGSNLVYPCIGGDTFRVDSHAGFAAVAIGEQLLNLVDSDPGKVSTIGVVEDEVHGFGRYYAMEYNPGIAAMEATRVLVYDSDYTAELESTTVDTAWDPFVELLPYVEVGMRVICLAGRTFLFYLVPSLTSTRVNVVELPVPGGGTSTAAPTEVITLSFVVRDRIYVVEDSPTTVFLYIGDTEQSPSQRTLLVRYDVAAQSVTGSMVVKDGATPFPRSYAATRGRMQFGETPVHMLLEPQTSWSEGAGRSIDDFPGVGSVSNLPTLGTQHAPLFRQSTGNAWTIVTTNQNGSTVEDTVTFQGSDIKPWMSGAEADAQGGQQRAAAVPRLLTRVSPPPEAYAALKTTPTEDNSDVYILHAAAMIQYQGILQDDAFVYRQGQDAGSTFYRNTHGNHRGMSNVFEGNPPPFDTTNRRDTTILVPGTILIENAQSTPESGFQAIRTVGAVANRLDSWRLADNSTWHGQPHTGSEGDPGLLPTDHDPSTDAIHGVQGDVFDEDLSVVVGWFTHGFLP